MLILIVDDDEIARLSLSNILGGPGVDVVQASDGEEAWQQLEGGLRPDVCCSDILMPRLDGLGLMQRARAHPLFNYLPFILISSAADRETVQNAIAGGVAGYILKPFLAVQTRSTVERVARERSLEAAEAFPATLRRLAAGPAQLWRMLKVLQDDANALAATRGDDADPAARPLLQRLHGAAMLLGQRRAAALLHEAHVRPAAELAQVLSEVQRLVCTRLEELEAFAPGSAPQPAGTAAGTGSGA